MKHSQSHIHTIRNLRYHVRTWGDARSPKLFLLHGWMDVSASFQFLVDCLERDWYVMHLASRQLPHVALAFGLMTMA